MRDRIGSALIALGRRVKRTKRAEGGWIPKGTGGVMAQLSPGCTYVIPGKITPEDAETFRRLQRDHGTIRGGRS